jgi:hypothetical protein
MSKCRWVDTSDKVAGQDNGYLNFLFVLLKKKWKSQALTCLLRHLRRIIWSWMNFSFHFPFLQLFLLIKIAHNSISYLIITNNFLEWYRKTLSWAFMALFDILTQMTFVTKYTAWSRMTESVGNNENLNDFGTTVI